MMKRKIVLNPVEPALLSWRWPIGLDLFMEMSMSNGEGAIDLAFVGPVITLEPRSGGQSQSYAGNYTQSVVGTAVFAFPGEEIMDPNGYRVSLFGYYEGVGQLLARGIASMLPGPAIPSTVAEGVLPQQRGTYNISIVRFDSWTWQFTLWGDEAKTIPSDLTGATVTAQIRSSIGGPVIQNLAIDVRDAVKGLVWMSITSGQSGTLPPTAYWDMQITYPDGEIRTPVGGRVVVTDDVTRP